MTVSLVINGVTYNYPETGDTNWGAEATDWASAVTSGMLQKAGGSFVLLSEVDFGGSFGLKSLYYKTRTSNVASAGQIRLARADVVSWRNQANSADLDLAVNASNQLTFAGTVIQGAVTVADTSTIDLTLTGSQITADIVALSITDAYINGTAGINATKIAGGSVDNTEFGYLNGVTSAIQTQLDNKQPLDSDLTAIAALSSTGLIARTGSGSVSTRTVTGTANQLTVTNGDGVSGDPTLDIGSYVVRVSSGTGIVARTASATDTVRTITGTTNLIDVTNGDGVSGNPTLNVGSSVVTLTGTQVLTNKDYDGGTASNSLRFTVPQGPYATINALTRKEGTLLYGSDTNTLYIDNGSALVALAAATTGSKFLANRTSAQSIGNASVTKIQFNVEQFDTNNEYDSSTNYRFTPTTAGYYSVGTLVSFQTQDTGTQVQLYLQKNGSTIIALDDTQVSYPSNSLTRFMKTQTIVSMNGTTDYIEVYGYQSSGTRNTGDNLSTCQFWGFQLL